MNAIPNSTEKTINQEQPKSLIILAKIISYVFHPVFMPCVMSFFLYVLTRTSFSGINDRQLMMWLLSIFIATVFFPLFTIGLMKPLGFIGSFQMPTARDRTIPLMATMIFYFWISHVFQSINNINVPIELKVLLLGNFWGLVVLFIINIFTKISMHTTAAGGMIGIIIVLMINSNVNMITPLFITIVLAGIIGSARLVLGAHQKGDVWLGYIIGILVQLSAYMYLKTFS